MQKLFVVKIGGNVIDNVTDNEILGSVVLPILGAVPDGCIVLFSGLGPNAAEELAVGKSKSETFNIHCIG